MTLRDRLNQPRPLVVAHRGDWRDAPENSLAAVAAAGAFDMVEIDVRLSADRVPVLMHDPTLQRTAGRLEAVEDLVVAELSEIQLLGGSEKIPTLSQALAAAPGHLLFDIDVKEPEDLDSVGAFLAERPERARTMLKRDVRDGADLLELLALEARHGIPVVAKVVLASATDIDLIEEIRSVGVVAAEVWFANVDLVARASATGLPISVYTLDEIACDGFSDAAGMNDPEAIWGHLINIGVSLIMTDAPAEVRRCIALLFAEANKQTVPARTHRSRSADYDEPDPSKPRPKSRTGGRFGSGSPL